MGETKQAVIRKRKKSSLQKRQARAGYVFILPWVIGFLLFFLKPFFESLWYSFNDVTMTASGLNPKFVGLENYKFILFKEPQYLKDLAEALIIMITDTVVIIIMSLFVATILNQKFRGRTIYRAIFFLPVILTSGVVFSLMSGIVSGGTNIVSNNAYLFNGNGIQNILSSADISATFINGITMAVDVIFSALSKIGVQILLFISGLQKIPADAYEAAQIEGANRWDSFWKITIPKIYPIIFLNIVYTLIDSFTSYGSTSPLSSLFNTSGAMTGENKMMKAIHEMGVGKTMKFGLSASMAWFYFLIIAIILLVVFFTIGRKSSKMES